MKGLRRKDEFEKLLLLAASAVLTLGLIICVCSLGGD